MMAFAVTGRTYAYAMILSIAAAGVFGVVAVLGHWPIFRVPAGLFCLLAFLNAIGMVRQGPGPHATLSDLSTPEGAAAYRAELRKVGFWPRQIGYGLVIAGAITLIWMRWGHGSQNPHLWTAAMTVMVAGWVLLIVAILMRSRYHRRRLAGG